jgi:hypothetical protein
LAVEHKGAELALVTNEYLGFEAVGQWLLPPNREDGPLWCWGLRYLHVKAPEEIELTPDVAKRIRVAAVRRLANRLQDPADPEVSNAQLP